MPLKTKSGRATHGGSFPETHRLGCTRGVNREIEQQSKNWTNGKRLRMAMVFESWAKHLRGGAR